jgi:hypothetical protein
MQQNDATTWRNEKLLNQPNHIKAALRQWQDCNKITGHSLDMMIKGFNDAGLDMDTVMHVMTIWTSLVHAEPLPVRMVLWKAVEPRFKTPTKDTSKWMPTSATLEGAEAWAKDNLKDGKATIFRLVVSNKKVKALPVGSDEDLEKEKEILIAPNVEFKSSGKSYKTVSGNTVIELAMKGN